MKSILISFVFGLLLLITACKKEAAIQTNDYPFVITDSVTDVSSNGVTFNAKVLDKGKEEIVDFGFKWHYIYYNPPYGRVEVECDSSIYNTATLDDFNLQWNEDLRLNATYTVSAYIKTKNYFVLGNKVIFNVSKINTPVIKDFFPKEGGDGTIVKLTGSNFSTIYSEVLLNDKKVKILRVYHDSIIFKIPQSDFIGDAEISVNVLSVNVVSDKKFKIIGPEIETVSPLSGYSGDLVTIKGKYFNNNGSNIELYFGELRASIIDTSETVLTAIVSIMKDNLLDDKWVDINYKNGKKSIDYSEKFLVKHFWDKKQPPPYMAPSDDEKVFQGFSYNGDGYIFYPNENILFRFSPDNNVWEVASSSYYPGEKYNNCLFVVRGDLLYKIGGVDNMHQRKKEVWTYNFSSDVWTRQADIPFGFFNANFFEINDVTYVITGGRALWKCDFVNGQYMRLANTPFSMCEGFVSTFTINNNAFVAVCSNTWQYNEQNDTWIRKASSPISDHSSNNFRNHGFAYNNTGFLILNGNGLYKYDDNRNKWSLISKFPVDEYGSYKTSFVLEDKVYVASLWSNYASAAPFLFSYFEGD